MNKEETGRCHKCGHETHFVKVEGVHYAKEECTICKTWIRWLRKDKSDSSKYRRQKKHLNLVTKYSNGICEMCLLQEQINWVKIRLLKLIM